MSFASKSNTSQIRFPNYDDSRRASFWGWMVFAMILFLSGVAAHAVLDKLLMYPARYAATAVFGFLVGATELVSRYRDRPLAPLETGPGLIYIATNIVASVAALWVLQTKDVTFDFGTALPPALGQVLLAGFGTMIFFRSALFTVRVGESDVSIGPAAVLQVILNAADRSCDRLRAGPRSTRIHRIMRGISFDRAKQALPLFCFGLMQNVGTAEQTQLLQTIDALAAKSMTDEVKAYNLGLLLINVVGEDVLERAVTVLGPLILGPAADEPPILIQAPGLKPEDTMALIDMCVALDSFKHADRNADQIREDIKNAIKNTNDVLVQNVIALARLRDLFGAATVSRALALLSARSSPLKQVTAPLQASDLIPPKPATS